MPGINDLATRDSVSQKAALSGRSASFAIAPNRLSKAKASIPAEKHHVASERCFLQAAAAARAALNMDAANAKTVFGFTVGSELT
ncbi:MAG: hypothetical protein DME65_06345 [Verrucomicrobia bacterium]|nr:MAG: hypothetical protein DME65_06345 [Verrucomicrobiota bacterium]